MESPCNNYDFSYACLTLWCERDMQSVEIIFLVLNCDSFPLQQYAVQYSLFSGQCILTDPPSKPQDHEGEQPTLQCSMLLNYGVRWVHSIRCAFF